MDTMIVPILIVLSTVPLCASTPKPCSQGYYQYPPDSDKWKSPTSNCSYQLWWNPNGEDGVVFRLSARLMRDRWTGIAFARDKNLTNVDGIFVWLDPTLTNYVVMDAFMPNWSSPFVDEMQSVENIIVSAKNRIIEVRFTRKYDTRDSSQDLMFNNQRCLHFIYPVEGGSVDHEKQQVRTVDSRVVVSDEPICLHCYGPDTDDTAEFETKQTQPPTSAGSKGVLKLTSRPALASGPVWPMLQPCVGRWAYPRHCRIAVRASEEIEPLPLEAGDCTYAAQWQYVEATDSINFIVQTRTPDQWAGIGFAKSLGHYDAVIGLVNEDVGPPFIKDVWIGGDGTSAYSGRGSGYAYPTIEIDEDQNIYSIGAKRENGTTTLKFTRKRVTEDPMDFAFTDYSDDALVFLFEGRPFDSVCKRIHHNDFGLGTLSGISIESCAKPNSSDDSIQKSAGFRDVTSRPVVFSKEHVRKYSPECVPVGGPHKCKRREACPKFHACSVCHYNSLPDPKKYRPYLGLEKMSYERY